MGTRPEIVKCVPIVRKLHFLFVDCDQYYDYGLKGLFIDELSLPDSDYSVKVVCGHGCVQLADIMRGVGSVIGYVEPSVVLVEGDSNNILGFTLIRLRFWGGHLSSEIMLLELQALWLS